MTKDFYRSWPLAQTAVGRSFSAAAEVVEHFTDLRAKPEWGIDHTMINGKRFNVSINVVLEKPFCASFESGVGVTAGSRAGAARQSEPLTWLSYPGC